MQMLTLLGRRWWLVLPVIIAVALFVWQMQEDNGWLELAFGGFAWLYWLSLLAWALLTTVAIRQHRVWWLVVSAPFVLYPAYNAAWLLAVCASGSCL